MSPLLSEEAERERNVRQQMNIPSIRKENRMEETVPAPAEERVDVKTDVTRLLCKENSLITITFNRRWSV
ncbi:hypothetical protein ACEQPO_22215 [Bacillus sp. SL00103]